jgi:hypothetical protein
MKNIFCKAGDAILCLALYLVLALIFAGTVKFGKAAGKISHCHSNLLSKPLQPYSAAVLS